MTEARGLLWFLEQQPFSSNQQGRRAQAPTRQPCGGAGRGGGVREHLGRQECPVASPMDPSNPKPPPSAPPDPGSVRGALPMLPKPRKPFLRLLCVCKGWGVHHP